MKESIERVKETTESLTAKEEKLDDEINDTCDQLVIRIFIITIMRPRESLRMIEKFCQVRESIFYLLLDPHNHCHHVQ